MTSIEEQAACNTQETPTAKSASQLSLPLTGRTSCGGCPRNGCLPSRSRGQTPPGSTRPCRTHAPENEDGMVTGTIQTSGEGGSNGAERSISIGRDGGRTRGIIMPGCGKRGRHHKRGSTNGACVLVFAEDAILSRPLPFVDVQTLVLRGRPYDSANW